MANNVMKAKHAFGNTSNIEAAKQANKIDAFDILFLDGDTDPKIGWLDAQGNTVIVPNKTDLSGVEAEIATKANAKDVANLEVEIATKVNTDEVKAKYEEIKFEIANVPVGALVDYRDKEIRICCPADTAWAKQSVGEGGDANTYYCTLKTYAPDDAVGYREHMGNQVDEEILIDLKTDKYGRKYQPTWLGLAKYDEANSAWTYYGANSTSSKMIGWDYRIDWFDANGKMIASDGVRINLSNENCHSMIKPYYGVSEMTEVNTKIEEAVESANAYTDKKVAEIAEAAVVEVVEF